MVAGGRNVGMNRRQIESRRKKQLMRWISLLVRVLVLLVIEIGRASCRERVYVSV